MGPSGPDLYAHMPSIAKNQLVEHHITFSVQWKSLDDIVLMLVGRFRATEVAALLTSRLLTCTKETPLMIRPRTNEQAAWTAVPRYLNNM
jgi:hypothetical protein